jgi:hypothetical protein
MENKRWKYSDKIRTRGFRKSGSEPYPKAAVAMQTGGHKMLRTTDRNPCNLAIGGIFQDLNT